MSFAESLLSQVERTRKRYEERHKSRKTTALRLERGDYIKANEDEAMRSRMKHLGMAPAVTEGIGMPSFTIPERRGDEGTRGTIANVVLERILGKNDLMPISFLALGQFRGRSVGRVHIRDASGRRLGFGTGFLVSPRLLLTNNHVLESTADAAFSEVEFDFELDLAGNVRQTVSFHLDPAAFFLTDEHLDFSMVAVTPNDDRAPRDWGWHRLPEHPGLIVKGEYVSIIQHPDGEAKQLALRENRVIDLFDDFAHYHTDTAPGSSGSPVFNDQWEVVALHHSGVPEQFSNGDIKTVDGRKWEPGMGDHRIKWIANEGVSGIRIAEFVKAATGLNADQKRLRDELFNIEPPTPEGVRLVPPPIPNVPPSPPPQPVVQPPVGPNPVAGAAASWTIPLQITVNVGAVQNGTVAGSSVASAMPPIPRASPVPENDELRQALAELEEARTRPYYDADADKRDREAYYTSIDTDDLSPKALFRELGKLLKSTHANQPKYKPSLQVYPWVDLHSDRKLRSVYSGKTFEAEELIREDFRIEQERSQLLQELTQREGSLTAERMQEQVDLLEAQNPFNCEHVVPQSWYAKKEPMRGDLHHLFACESGCNSFRGNIPYFDFSDFEEALRTACGKREGKKFEPSAGKGVVARATLYFLLRYPGKVDDPEEFPKDRISTLLQWHADHPVGEYELHRNQAIFAKQGNRNPLIDFPDWAGKINFGLGLA